MVSKPKMPEVRYPDPLPPPPERSDVETSALAEQQRARFGRNNGRAMTMLTGGGGVESGSSAMRYLGGAAKT